MSIEPRSPIAPEFAFPFGLRVYFRTIGPDAFLHQFQMTKARDIIQPNFASPIMYVVDEDGETLATLIISAVSFILPLNQDGSASC